MCHTWARAAAAAGQGVPFHEFCSLARVCTELLEQQTGQGGGHLQTEGGDLLASLLGTLPMEI